ncbi:WD repeat-containing protein 74 isoform X6 [Fukomys damarensis]|uniref:WD repeat-containing protein 74 isoform X6 n=1 Tax=Fukomys damarensis TaxID=885580 RepID=UPI00053F589B|nr:WD repeat-containing protein 74 isoform X6 [Fukomys damarensis]
MAAASARSNHVWVGTETGILKGVDLQRKLAANFTTTGQPQREAAVNALCWGASDETQILVGCADRTVRRFSTKDGAFQGQRRCPGGEGTFRGLAQADSTFITCVDSGVLRVWRSDDKEAPSDPLLELKVRHDWLDLRVPVWDQDIQFLPGSQKLVTCTGYHQVRVYDPASPQRRPVLETTFGEYPLTAMTLTPGGNSVIVGNTHGQLAEIDFRKGRLLGCLKGLAGSVRELQCHPSKPMLASCGLDRILRIHRIQNPRGLEHKIYLKSRLNCLLLSGRENWRDELELPQERSEEPPQDSEVDELWASLEVAAKRKLPRVDQTLRALGTQERKKKCPGALSPQPCE